MATSNSEAPFRFLELPTEIRLRIYPYLLTTPPGESFDLEKPLCDWAGAGVSSDVLLTSKAIFKEAFLIFLRDNDFLLGGSEFSPTVFSKAGKKACSSIRYLSIHLNTRPATTVKGILGALNHFCTDLNRLELRTQPNSAFLPSLARILMVRSQLPKNGAATITLDLSILVRDNSAPAVEKTKQTKIAISNAFSNPGANNTLAATERYRIDDLLTNTKNIVIRGCLSREVLEVFEQNKPNAWEFTETSTRPLEADNDYRSHYVVRTWVKKESSTISNVTAAAPQYEALTDRQPIDQTIDPSVGAIDEAVGGAIDEAIARLG